jgi:predicted dinucleotide-binding enzyme
MTTIGFIGSGLIGSTLARLALATGHDVVVANSRGPETLAGLVEQLGAHARAADAAGAAAAAELAVVTIPLRAYRQVPVEPLAGKVVLDTDNYYPQRDGVLPELEDESTTSSELLQAHLPTSRVVKAFNSIHWEELGIQGTPAGTPARRALPIAGDDAEAKATAAALIDSFGFDVVDAGPLSEGWRFQPGTPAYGPRFDREELVAALASAQRGSGPRRSGTDER